MKKEEVQQRVLYLGYPLGPHLFDWDETSKTFKSSMNNLVIDFRRVNDCTFLLANRCTLISGANCNIHAGFLCVFDTEGGCKFETGDNCVLVIWPGCTWEKTGRNCVVVIRRITSNEVIQLH
jgi:hypothetical protein